MRHWGGIFSLIRKNLARSLNFKTHKEQEVKNFFVNSNHVSFKTTDASGICVVPKAKRLRPEICCWFILGYLVVCQKIQIQVPARDIKNLFFLITKILKYSLEIFHGLN